jgi:hypothetical protein
MSYVRRQISPARVLFVAAFVLIILVSIAKVGRASIGTISKADLSGPWLITLGGNTGCGLGTLVATATLNTSGAGPATITTHGQCGNGVITGQTFTIISLNSNGSGTAGLTCGTGCGWTLTLQVSPDRSTMNLADVSASNPNNFLVGSAVHQ